MKKYFSKFLSVALTLLLTASVALPASAVSKPEKVSSFQSYRVDDDEINLRWKKSSGAYVYQVYVYNNGSWDYVGGTKKLRYEVDNLLSAKQYKFKVRAYKLSAGKKVYGPFSEVVTAATEPDEVENLYASSVYKKTVTLKWKSEKRATGYQVYVYSRSKDKYVKKASVKTNSVTLRDLNSDTSYRFKVRAYYKADGEVYYGEFSDVLSVKTKASASSASAESSSQPTVNTSKAASIALKSAGLKKNQVKHLSCELDVENGVRIYEVEFDYGKYEYSYDIDAESGKILHKEKDRD